jgi:hypothetical protein
MPVSTAFSISGSLLFPPDEGATPVPIAFGVTGQAVSEEGGRLSLTGSGTKVVPFGTVGSPGAKAVLIEYLPSSLGTPIEVTFNGGTDVVEISQGGFIAMGNPTPTDGITSISIAHTSDCQVRVKLLG